MNKRKIRVEQIHEALDSFEKIGDLLGKDNSFYLGAIEGLNRQMNIEFEQYMQDAYTREAMYAEALIQCMICGAYVDMSDVRREFQFEHWVQVIEEYAHKQMLA